MPLGMAVVGLKGKIKQVSGGDDVRRHLADYGFIEGEEIRVEKENGGYIVLAVKNGTVTLDKTTAMRITV